MALGADKQAEIDSLSATPWRRRAGPRSKRQNLLYDPVPVLDHGFIRLIDYMGTDDAAIVRLPAFHRQRGTKQISGDRGLINI